MEKRKILFVAPYFLPDGGGLERYMYEIIRQMNREEWDVEVLTTSTNGVDEVEECFGHTVHRLAIGFKISNTPFSFSWFLKVRKILKQSSPDIVNVHMPVPGIGDVVTFLLPKKTPLVITYHFGSMMKGGGFADMLIWIYEHTLLRYVLGKAKHIVSSSDEVRYDFLKKYIEKSSTIFPAIDDKTFTPASSLKESVPTAVFVASLEKGAEHKGLETLLRAFVLVKKEIDDAQVRIVGEGTKMEYYKDLVRELKLDNSVTFTGKLYGERLAHEYQKAHVFAFPTEYESFGMVIAEAMACGLPVVSTRVGGVPLLVEHGKTGILIEPNDSKNLAQELIAMLGNLPRAHTMGVAGRDKISKGYSWTERAHAFEQTYRQSLEDNKKVAHIVGYYPPHVGGMEVVALELAQEQARRGHSVRVFTSNIGAKKEERTEKETNYIVKRLNSIEFAHTPIMWTLPLRLLLLPRKTILHIHLAQALIPEIALLVSKIRRFPTVFHFHLDVEPSGKLGKLFVFYKKHILGFVLRNGNSIIVFSKEQKDFVSNTYKVKKENIHIVPNGVRKEYFVGKMYAPHTPRRLIFVGRLTVQKRVDRLIEAVSNLPQVELTIVGDGEDRNTLEEQAASLDHVTFVGSKKPNEVENLLKDADIFVTASDKEGMPLAVLEAMAIGLPVVAYDVVGLREIVQNVGVLVSDVSSEGLEKALSELVERPETLKKLSEQSIRFARTHTWESVSERVEKLYKQL